MKAYVLNLEHDVARRESVLKSLRSLGIKPVVIHAVYGKTIPPSQLVQAYDDVTAKREAKRSLYPGEIGCALSHLKAYERIVSEGDDVAIIMEDDVIVDESLLEAIDSLAARTVNADILLLGHHPPHSHDAITQTSMWGRLRLRNQRFIGFPVETAFGAYCYLITARAAKLILDLNQPVWQAADYFTAGAEGAICTMVMIPPIARVNFSLGSHIQEDRVRRGDSPRKGLLYLLARAIKPSRVARTAVRSAFRECGRAALAFRRGPRPPAAASMKIPRHWP